MAQDFLCDFGSIIRVSLRHAIDQEDRRVDIFALSFLGFLTTTGIGATSITLLAVPRWRVLGRRGLVVTTVAVCALWFVIAHRVDFAGTYAWSSVGYFGVAAGLPGLVAGAVLAAGDRSSRKSLVAAAVLVGLALWLVLAALLGFGTACNLDARCDL
jgi:hypothetical protein